MMPPPVYTLVISGSFCWKRFGGKLAVRHAFVNSATGVKPLFSRGRLGVFRFELSTAKGFR